jgi:hypothetical protein
MINLLPLSILVVALCIQYLMTEFPSLPENVAYTTDLLIVMVSVFVVMKLIVSRNWTLIPLRYLAVFAAFVYVVISGLLLNDVTPDTAFAGIRTVLKYVPLFLIPFAFFFSESDVKAQFIVLTAIVIAQVPVTFWQKFVAFSHLYTGDVISGTFTNSSSVSIICAGAIIVLAGLYLDKRISIVPSMILACLFLIPASLSETKITPIFLALGVGAVLYSRRNKIPKQRILLLTMLGSLLIGSFVLIYDQLYGRDGSGYFEVMTDKERIVDNYNFKGIKAKPLKIDRGKSNSIIVSSQSLQSDEDLVRIEVGRMDSLVLPFSALFPHEYEHLLFGLGIGNVNSTFGSGAKYKHIAYELGGSDTSMSMLIWETGVIGAFLCMLFLVFVALDAYRLSSTPGFDGTLGASCVGVLAIAILCQIYTNLYNLHDTSVLLFYFSGLVVARASRHKETSAYQALNDNNGDSFESELAIGLKKDSPI